MFVSRATSFSFVHTSKIISSSSSSSKSIINNFNPNLLNTQHQQFITTSYPIEYSAPISPRRSFLSMAASRGGGSTKLDRKTGEYIVEFDTLLLLLVLLLCCSHGAVYHEVIGI